MCSFCAEFSNISCTPSLHSTKYGMPQHLKCELKYKGKEIKVSLNRNNPGRYRLPVYSLTDDKLDGHARDYLQTKVSTDAITDTNLGGNAMVISVIIVFVRGKVILFLESKGSCPVC